MFLAGPVIAVLSGFLAVFCVLLSLAMSAFAILFSFALVGFVIWLPFRLLRTGKMPAGREIVERGKHLWLAFLPVFRWSVCETGKLARAALSTTRWRGGWQTLQRRAWFISGFLVEVVSGAAVGALLGWMTAGPATEFLALGAGAGLGAVLGVFVALLRTPVVESEIVTMVER